MSKEQWKANGMFLFQFHQTLRTYLEDFIWDFNFYVSKNWPEDPICLHFPGMTSSVRFINFLLSFFPSKPFFLFRLHYLKYQFFLSAHIFSVLQQALLCPHKGETSGTTVVAQTFPQSASTFNPPN